MYDMPASFERGGSQGFLGKLSLNNNRGNNRRRGRGNNRQQGGGQLNRVDSRARGNAPQMLEKYRKMAHDAHLNGDRVQEETYLQFADHYFRVTADQRQRQEDARQPRQEDGRQPRREDRPQEQNNAGSGDSDSAQGPDERNADNGRGRDDKADHSQVERNANEPEGAESEAADTAVVRRGQESRPRKPRRAPREDNEDGGDTNTETATAASGLDPSALPPAISEVEGDIAGGSKEAAEAKPRRRTRRSPTPAGDSTDTLKVVS